MDKKYTRSQVLNFKEEDWIFRRSSGYAGYDHKDSIGDEQKWIYEKEYMERKQLKAQYAYEFSLISEFRMEQLPWGKYPDIHIHEFLSNKYFKLENPS